jgi:hypothetical protein
MKPDQAAMVRRHSSFDVGSRSNASSGRDNDGFFNGGISFPFLFKKVTVFKRSDRVQLLGEEELGICWHVQDSWQEKDRRCVEPFEEPHAGEN